MAINAWERVKNTKVERVQRGAGRGSNIHGLIMDLRSQVKRVMLLNHLPAFPSCRGPYMLLTSPT